jgi:hypothetical protein
MASNATFVTARGMMHPSVDWTRHARQLQRGIGLRDLNEKEAWIRRKCAQEETERRGAVAGLRSQNVRQY